MGTKSAKNDIRVVVISLWRNDENKRIRDRIDSLLNKTYSNLHYIWIVGDSFDGTESILRETASQRLNVSVICHDTCIIGDEPDTRLARLSETFNAGLDFVNPADDKILVHESDIVSPPDVVERMLSHSHTPIAGWPVLRLDTGEIFYDTWAYRAGGVHFSNHPPYHSVYNPSQLFEVDSVGTVWMFDADEVLGMCGIRCGDFGCIDLCNQLRARGRRIMVDPTLTVIQPADLWVSRSHANG